MAALTAQTVTAAGAEQTAAVQISAWSSPDTIASSVIGSRGVVAIVANSSGGPLEFRVQDPGRTPAGNPAADGYTTVTVPDGETHVAFIGPNNVDPADGLCDVGADTTNAGFVVQLLRY
ncbi:hypothetical protein ACFHW1_04940 [Micromonospora sp. LOL_014]|uniref:hypothetical protein n=1 Tax=Micromonospora sp. LOL_014 TaxID=3345415 RepID=UPI003A8A0AB4